MFRVFFKERSYFRIVDSLHAVMISVALPETSCLRVDLEREPRLARLGSPADKDYVCRPVGMLVGITTDAMMQGFSLVLDVIGSVRDNCTHAAAAPFITALDKIRVPLPGFFDRLLLVNVFFFFHARIVRGFQTFIPLMLMLKTTVFACYFIKSMVALNSVLSSFKVISMQ